VRLDELPESPLPPSGTLLVFFALTSKPSGMRPWDGGACRVMHVADGPKERVERDRALAELPVVPSAELTLPLEPSLLGDTADIGAWTRLRERLAALQEVELEETSAAYHALHRLLGYPDVLVDGMELEAQLVAHGVDLTGADHYVDARVEELRPGAASWRLLFQLSSDDDLGVALGDYERLYVWIREGDLASGRFDRVRAFVR
jgi:hypothetical protein